MATADHDALVAVRTGGLAPDPDRLAPFPGSDRLRPDGRPLPALRSRLRRIRNVRNAWTVIWTAALAVGIVGATTALDRWYVWPFAVFAMGTVFARLSILNHEAAHRLLFSDRFWNDLIGQRLIGLAVFGDGGPSYRLAHSQHHRDEFGPREPDFGLYAGYPVPRDSLRRKLVRDASGISGWKILRPVLVGLTRPRHRARAVKTIAGQAVVFGIFALAGHPWSYAVLWFLPWFTVWRVLNRLRALAEHAGMTRSTDRRRTTHHVRQHRLAQAALVPFNTGYHLAHHVDSGIPFRSLPALHRALEEDGYLDGVVVHRSYRAFWRTCVRTDDR